MNDTGYIDSEVFAGGLLFRLQKSRGLRKPNHTMRIVWWVTLAVLLGWVPLVVLSSAQDITFGGDRARALLLDFAVYVRCFIVIPLLIIAESVCIPRLGRTAYHFLDAGLVPVPDRARFDAAVAASRRLRSSKVAELVIVLFAYAVIGVLIRYLPSEAIPAWHKAGDGGSAAFSVAGWWHVLVSLPLLLIPLGGWLWCLLLWGQFLWRMARLDLILIPSHPDHAAGLQFLGYSLRAFGPLGMALGALGAGMTANRVVHGGAPLSAHADLVVALVVGVVILFCGPLLIFTGKLLQERRRGTFEYGVLAHGQGQQFEQKWLKHAQGVDADMLSVPDFSATTDLYQVVANVYDMRAVPIDLRNLGVLIVVTLLPFLPVVFMAMPLDVILTKLLGLLL